MQQIEQIYLNEIGMAFYWKKENAVISNKIQLVFKETGFYFTVSELHDFAALIEDSCRKNTCCDCEMQQQCVKFLLKTPVSQIDLAVTRTELNGIKDLVIGTLFQIKLAHFIYGVGRN